jgi:two-component system cell cycle response regulator
MNQNRFAFCPHPSSFILHPSSFILHPSSFILHPSEAWAPFYEMPMRVLVADDNKDSAETLAILLRAWGFEPVVVHDGPAALARLRSNDAPTLALLDWIMPGMNGIDLCREIRRETTRPYAYLILVTGRGSREQMLDGMNSGADDYLLKPIEPNELHARLNAAKRILELQEQLLTTQRLLREQATRDSLTGIWNRAMILEILHQELVRSRREGHPLAVIMADIDHFKNINDTHGHLVGDHMLRLTAQRMLSVLRAYDMVGLRRRGVPGGPARLRRGHIALPG